MTTYMDLPHLWFPTRLTWLMTWTEALFVPPPGNFNMVGRIAEAGLTYANSNMVSHGQAPAQAGSSHTNQLKTTTNKRQMYSQLFGNVD